MILKIDLVDASHHLQTVHEGLKSKGACIEHYFALDNFGRLDLPVDKEGIVLNQLDPMIPEDHYPNWIREIAERILTSNGVRFKFI